MTIDLRLLRFAKALMDHGSFSRAADALNMAQPSLSRGIQELESRAGAQLFKRSRLGNELTDFGRVFMQHAEKILQHSHDLEQEVALVKGLDAGEVSLAMGPYACEALALRCALAFSRSRPSHRIRISQAEPGVALRMLRDRKTDLLVVDSSIVDEDDVTEMEAFPPLSGQVLVREGHPLLRLKNPGMADIFEYPFLQVVTLPARVLPYRHRDKAGNGLPFPFMVCPSLRTAMGVMMETDAFTLGHASVAGDLVSSGRIVPLDFTAPWLHLRWGVFRLRNREIPATAHAAVDALRQAHAQLVEDEAAMNRQAVPGHRVVPARLTKP
jgi:DNA-binding transcriptional LysR family regulator